MIGHQNALNIVGKDPCIGSHKSVLLSGQSSGTGDKKKEKKKKEGKKESMEPRNSRVNGTMDV